MGMARNTRERGREQAGMSREGRRTMEKVLENMVRDKTSQKRNDRNWVSQSCLACPYCLHPSWSHCGSPLSLPSRWIGLCGLQIVENKIVI